MERNDIFSKKVSILNFILSMFVVLLHANCSLYITNESTYFLKYFFQIVRIIGDIAVPTFFALSSYLFFRNFVINKYKEKLIKRIYSLVIPYFFWSILCWMFYAIVMSIPQLSQLINKEDVSFKIIDIINAILYASYDPPIWFIKTLFEFVLIAPILYYAITKFNKYSLIIPIIFILLNIIKKFSYTSLVFWLPVFFYGAYLSLRKGKLIEKEKLITKNRKAILIITIIIYLLFIISMIGFDEKSNFYYIYRIISPIFILIILDYINLQNTNIKPWMKNTFFIFCTHYPIITIIKRIIIKLLGNSTMGIIATYILSIVITLAIIFILAYILEKYLNKLWVIINGGRK